MIQRPFSFSLCVFVAATLKTNPLGKFLCFKSLSAVVVKVRTQSSTIPAESLKIPVFKRILWGGRTEFAACFVFKEKKPKGWFCVKYKNTNNMLDLKSMRNLVLQARMKKNILAHSYYWLVKQFCVSEITSSYHRLLVVGQHKMEIWLKQDEFSFKINTLLVRTQQHKIKIV